MWIFRAPFLLFLFLLASSLPVDPAFGLEQITAAECQAAGGRWISEGAGGKFRCYFGPDAADGKTAAPLAGDRGQITAAECEAAGGRWSSEGTGEKSRCYFGPEAPDSGKPAAPLRRPNPDKQNAVPEPPTIQRQF